MCASALSPGTDCAPRLALVLERLATEHTANDRHGVAHRPERLLRLRPDVVEEDLRRAEAEEEPARACSLLHDSCIHRNLHRMARERRDDPPADREPVGLARHERRDDGRRARLHPVLPPPRVRLGEPDRVHPGLVHDTRRLEHLVERLHGELHDADPERWRHRGSGLSERRGAGRFRDALFERCEHLRDLLVHDRLQHALPHGADGPRDLDVGLPGHRGAAAGLGERERRRHVHQRADALALRAHRRELGLALLEPLEVHGHLEAAEAERHLDLRRPVLLVSDLERLDTGHELGHLGRLVDDAPHGLARCGELLRTRDDHLDTTSTFARVAAGSWSIDHTLCGGLQLV